MPVVAWSEEALAESSNPPGDPPIFSYAQHGRLDLETVRTYPVRSFRFGGR